MVTGAAIAAHSKEPEMRAKLSQRGYHAVLAVPADNWSDTPSFYSVIGYYAAPKSLPVYGFDLHPLVKKLTNSGKVPYSVSFCRTYRLDIRDDPTHSVDALILATLLTAEIDGFMPVITYGSGSVAEFTTFVPTFPFEIAARIVSAYDVEVEPMHGPLPEPDAVEKLYAERGGSYHIRQLLEQTIEHGSWSYSDDQLRRYRDAVKGE